MTLCCHNSNEINQYVVPKLKIKDLPLTEEEMRELRDDRAMARAIAGKKRERERRDPLKGLSMELLAASILRHLDQCPRVVAPCATRNQQPHTVAQGGVADVSAYFPDPGEGQAFTLLAEVSARRAMPDDKYLDQLERGLKHAQSEWDRHPGSLIYCLMVNGGKIHKDRQLHRLYLDFIKENQLTADSDIRMVPMYAPDFGFLAGRLGEDLSHGGHHFKPEVLRNALDITYQQVLEPKLPEDRMWMIDRFYKAIFDELPPQESEVREEFRGPGDG